MEIETVYIKKEDIRNYDSEIPDITIKEEINLEEQEPTETNFIIKEELSIKDEEIPTEPDSDIPTNPTQSACPILTYVPMFFYNLSQASSNMPNLCIINSPIISTPFTPPDNQVINVKDTKSSQKIEKKNITKLVSSMKAIAPKTDKIRRATRSQSQMNGCVNIKKSDIKDNETTSKSIVKKEKKENGSEVNTKVIDLEVQETTFKCDICWFKTKFKWAFEAHSSVHSDAASLVRPIRKGKGFSCVKCGVNYTRKSNAVKHINAVHIEPAKSGSFCTICKQLVLEVSRVRHVRRHLERVRYCKFCRKEVKVNLQKHISEYHPFSKFYSCKLCTYHTSEELSYIFHNIKHGSATSKKQITEIMKCSICGMSFRTQRGLNRHFLFKHRRLFVDVTRIRFYRCCRCSYFSKSKLKLHLHVRKDHLKGAKKKPCSRCNFSSLHQRTLCRHSLTHLQSLRKVYVCGKCGYRTQHARFYKNHNIGHPKIKTKAKKRVYKCPNCPYKASILHSHSCAVKDATELRCDRRTCHLRTVSKTVFKRHTEFHERADYCNRMRRALYKCILCSFVTNVKINYIEHINGHNMDHEHNCKLCKFTVTEMTNHVRFRPRWLKYPEIDGQE